MTGKEQENWCLIYGVSIAPSTILSGLGAFHPVDMCDGAYGKDDYDASARRSIIDGVFEMTLN